MSLDFALDREGAESLIKDELKMVTSFNMKSKDDRLFINVLMHKIDIDSKFG